MVLAAGTGVDIGMGEFVINIIKAAFAKVASIEAFIKAGKGEAANLIIKQEAPDTTVTAKIIGSRHSFQTVRYL